MDSEGLRGGSSRWPFQFRRMGGGVKNCFGGSVGVGVSLAEVVVGDEIGESISVSIELDDVGEAGE